MLNDSALSEFAYDPSNGSRSSRYQPGGGVAHYFDGTPHVRGLLDDQVAMAAASLDAFEATGNVVYEMMAQELALYSMRTMWDGERAASSIAPVPEADERVGLMRERLKPFAANCDAARVLKRSPEQRRSPIGVSGDPHRHCPDSSPSEGPLPRISWPSAGPATPKGRSRLSTCSLLRDAGQVIDSRFWRWPALTPCAREP